MSIVANTWGFGVKLVLSTGQDVTGATLTLTVTRPDGSGFSRSGGDVTLGTQALVVDSITYPANTYAEYQLRDGDLDQGGPYAAQLVATWASPAKQLASETKLFQVVQ